MGRPSIFTTETLALARKLREEDGKTFAEISKILGINDTSIKKAAKKENWSVKKANENKEESIKATDTVKTIKQSNKELNKLADELVNKLQEIGINNIQNFGKLALEPLLLKNIRIALTSNNHKLISETIKDVLKLMESEAFALKDTERKLTVMVPALREVYEDPPENFKDDGNEINKILRLVNEPN